MTSFSSRFSLRSVMILNIIVPMLVVIVIAAGFGLRALENVVEDRMQEDVQLVARAISVPVSYSLEKDRFGSISQTLQSVFKIGRVYGAYVYDAGGERIAKAGHVEPDKKKDDLVDVARSGKRTGQYEDIEGRRVYSYFVPLFDTSGRGNGLLQITRRKSDIENYISTLRFQITAALILTGLFIAGYVLFGFHKAAGRYFTRLGQTMARIQSGDRLCRACPEGPKEIASLAGSLNAMLDGMDRSEKEIVQRREAQQNLQHKLRESEKMAVIGRLAAGVAHELGGPLSLIDGKAQRCLRDKTIIRSGHENVFQDIRKQVGRMNDIVRQLLEFGKGEKGHKRWSRIDQLAVSAVSTVTRETEGKIPVVAGGSKEGPLFYVDPLRFEQALTNLLRNALQSRGVTMVRLDWEFSKDNEVVFRIEDDGPGIDDAVKSRIFEPFFSTRRTGYNTGLGLAVVNGIVQEHGGMIRVFDSGMGGAGFQITIPPQTPPEQKRG